MDYMTTKEAAAKWGVTDRMVLYHCTAGRIAGASKMGNFNTPSENPFLKKANGGFDLYQNRR